MESRVSVVATDACGWPNLIKLENGELLCFYFNAPSHGLMEGDIVCSPKYRGGQMLLDFLNEVYKNKGVDDKILQRYRLGKYKP